MARISEGNLKLGNIPNISLVPCKDCRSDAPCKKDCYARKAFKQYPNVRKAWGINSDQIVNDRDGYFADVRDYIAQKSPDFFRWHIAGDIPDAGYLLQMCLIARDYPNTKFLAFSKQHELLTAFRDKLPPNLTIVASMWPGWGTAPKGYPRAWMQDGTETRVPKSALMCPGTCHNCGACWNLKKLKKDVVFKKH